MAVNRVPVADRAKRKLKMALNLDAGKVDVAVQTEGGQNAVRVIDVAGTPAADNVAKQTADRLVAVQAAQSDRLGGGRQPGGARRP